MVHLESGGRHRQHIGDGGAADFPLGAADAAPVGIASDAQGALWIAQAGNGAIARFDAGGRITEFPLHSRAARPHALAADAAGNLWFTEWGANRIGRISEAGDTAGYELAAPGSEPHGIAIDPHGCVWAALETGSLVRLQASPRD